MVLGHEGLGIIDEVGDRVHFERKGQRVVIEPNIPCRHCEFCLTGRGNICPNKKVIGLNRLGCFAGYVNVPVDFCWHIPDSISDENAVTIEPTAVGVHALFNSRAKPGDTIAVIGLGAIGLLLVHLAHSLGYQVVVNDLSRNKVAFAEKLGGKPIYLDYNDVQSHTGNLQLAWQQNDVSVIFECSGSVEAVTQTLKAAPRGSDVTLLGLSEKMAQFSPLQIVREGVRISVYYL